ncbi:GtrA family protein [Nocardioides solisilvae]|uniref:GtrA family protein n=1 Tax=Nocardioides solisilvae TaxID=1542435 RepID=UPI000D74D19F|nr:GtrA family protein [Nocardioides solisilvae]
MPRGTRRVAADATRFLVVGAVATTVALLIFNGLVHGFTKGSEPPLNDRPQLAYFLANVVGMLVSFRGTRDWAFRSRGTRHNDGGRTAFVVINLVTMVIPMGFLWISRNLLGLDDPVSDNIAANVLGLFAGTSVRFLLLRQYVFPRSFAVTEPVSGP